MRSLDLSRALDLAGLPLRVMCPSAISFSRNGYTPRFSLWSPSNGLRKDQVSYPLTEDLRPFFEDSWLEIAVESLLVYQAELFEQRPGTLHVFVHLRN